MAEGYTVRVHFIDDSTRIVPIKPGSLQRVGEEGAARYRPGRWARGPDLQPCGMGLFVEGANDHE